MFTLMPAHKVINTVITTVTKSPDWSAIGDMLSGVGTIIGAVAVIVGAYIGGNSFAHWRKQQLLQKHMELADRVLTTIFKAREQFSSIRSPLKEGSEFEAAEAKLVANGIVRTDYTAARWTKMKSAQVSLTRLHHYKDTWAELAAVKPSAHVYFGEDVSKKIDAIQHQIVVFQVDVEAYAEDNGSDGDFTKGLMKTMSRGRPTGQIDEFAKVMDDAIAAIEEKLKPLITDAASANQKMVLEFAKEVARKASHIYF